MAAPRGRGVERDPLAAREAWESARRVLAVRLDSLGDVLMTTPALRALQESVPGRRITLMTGPAGAPAAMLVPELDDVLVYESPWIKATPPRGDSEADRSMIATLRGRFDAAVIFTVYSQSALPAALLCYLADIPLRLAHCRENPYQLLTDWVADPEPSLVRHEVRRQLDLVAVTGARTRDERLSVRVPPGARRHVLRLLLELGIDLDRPWAIVHPGASAPSRRYPAHAFGTVARRLVIDHGWQLVFTGSAEEQELVESIRAAAGVGTHSVAGRLDLGGLAALLSLGPVLIANNTGPVHVAAAVGAPVVDLYALTNPQHTPWGVPHRVLFADVPCKYCYKSVCPEGHHDCLRRVAPAAVVEAALALLDEARAAGHEVSL